MGIIINANHYHSTLALNIYHIHADFMILCDTHHTKWLKVFKLFIITPE